MKKLLCFLVVLCSACIAQADITIEVPAEKIEAGRDYLLSVKGLTEEALSRVEMEVRPIGVKAIGVSGWGGEQYLWFNSPKEGTVVISLIAWSTEESALTLIFVGEGDKPDPIPTPTPPGDREIVVIYEASNQTPQTNLVQSGLRRWALEQKIPCQIIDQHQRDGDTNQPAVWLQPLRKKVESNELPQILIVVRSKAGLLSVVVADALPQTVETAVKFVQKHISAEKGVK